MEEQERALVRMKKLERVAENRALSEEAGSRA